MVVAVTWTKLGDEFGDECWTLSDKAFRLHTEGLLWSNRMLTDGKLAKDEMRRWARRPESAEELVCVGWWEDHGLHYQIVHHLGYQRTREQVARQSLANSKNRAKGKTRPVRQKEDSSDGPSVDSSDGNGLSDESSDERDGTGQAGTRERAKQKNDDYAEDYRTWCEEEPTNSFTPTADQLDRIEANIRAGYQS
ncbi:hypothetical protein ACRU43_16960 [Mycobacterium colombiense]